MINATYSTLYKAPEALDGVSMGIPNHILAKGMITTHMTESGIFKGVVNRIFVCKDECFALDVISDKGHYCGTFDVGNRFNTNLAVALCNTYHRDFVRTFGWPTLVITPRLLPPV